MPVIFGAGHLGSGEWAPRRASWKGYHLKVVFTTLYHGQTATSAALPDNCGKIRQLHVRRLAYPSKGRLQLLGIKKPPMLNPARGVLKMVPKGRLELPRVAPHGPQPCASTNSTTSAKDLWVIAPAFGVIKAFLAFFRGFLSLFPSWWRGFGVTI